jgi:hypothetical protein
VVEDITCPTGLVKIWSPAPFRVRPGPHTLDTIHERKVILCHSFFPEIRNGERFIIWYELDTGAIARRVDACPSQLRSCQASDTVQYCSSTIRNLKFFFSSATYPRPTRCRPIVFTLPRHDYLPFIKIAVFQRNMWNMGTWREWNTWVRAIFPLRQSDRRLRVQCISETRRQEGYLYKSTSIQCVVA